MFSLLLYMVGLDDGTSFKGLLGFICLFGAFQVLAGRFIFWNIFGKESIVIAPGSITYSRSYGILRMPSKVITFNQLFTEIEIMRQEEESKSGILHFYDRIQANGQLKRIFSTAVYLPEVQLKDFEIKLAELLQQASRPAGLFYSLN